MSWIRIWRVCVGSRQKIQHVGDNYSGLAQYLAMFGHVSGLGGVQHRDFAMASGEMSKEQFTGFLKKAFGNLANHSADGSIHFICMDWRHMPEMLEAGDKVFSELKNLIVWAKDNGGMGTFSRSRHELIFAFKNGTAPHINSFELGQHGRYRTNVWAYKGMNSFGAGRDADLALHPTVKPVAMIADAIKDVSTRNGIVLDLFGGSGSTLIAAHKTGHRGYTCELDPVYCDRIICRWQSYSKDDAVLESTGYSFAEVSQDRSMTTMTVDPNSTKISIRKLAALSGKAPPPYPAPEEAQAMQVPLSLEAPPGTRRQRRKESPGQADHNQAFGA